MRPRSAVAFLLQLLEMVGELAHLLSRSGNGLHKLIDTGIEDRQAARVFVYLLFRLFLEFLFLLFLLVLVLPFEMVEVDCLLPALSVPIVFPASKIEDRRAMKAEK